NVKTASKMFVLWTRYTDALPPLCQFFKNSEQDVFKNSEQDARTTSIIMYCSGSVSLPSSNYPEQYCKFATLRCTQRVHLSFVKIASKMLALPPLWFIVIIRSNVVNLQL
uniref:hypothetical protein n=1 Tax=Spirulina sp. CCY15215 TaxID=2767591 RepID=UPI0019516D07